MKIQLEAYKVLKIKCCTWQNAISLQSIDSCTKFQDLPVKDFSSVMEHFTNIFNVSTITALQFILFHYFKVMQENG